MPAGSALRTVAVDLDRRSAVGQAPAVEGRASSRSDEDEFEATLLAHRDVLLARALRLAGNPEVARDLVQDTIERALRRRTSFVAGTNARAWLFTILTNRFLDQMRRNTVVTEVAFDGHDVAQDPPPTDFGVTADQLHAAVQALPVDLRQVVTLHDLEGASYRDIAARLQLPMGTIGTRLSRARARLSQVLRPRKETR
jgi:RNA polymerase sigma-70 factor (ECF subfamily)